MKKIKNLFLFWLKWGLFCLITAAMGKIGYQIYQENQPVQVEVKEEEPVDDEQFPADEEGDFPAEKDEFGEKNIYTFSQGPVAWKEQYSYAGEWCQEVLEGNLFSVFGCGLCAMANVYSTLSPYECSPIDMYQYARDMTGYSPSKGYGAIDWEYMERALNQCGIYTCLSNKNPSLEEFCETLKVDKAAICLVASYIDDTYWKDTAGHYVTIWLYDEETQTVFLGDSGDPEHNRSRIPVQYVYDALCTDSEYQYLQIYTYEEEDNSWKHDGIDSNWIPPVRSSQTEQTANPGTDIQ